MAYKEAASLYQEERKRISKAAEAMLTALDIPHSQTNIEQAEIMALAALMFNERNQLTPDAWRSVGFLGNLLTANGKAVRLMSQLWYHKDGSPNSEKPVDNAVDCINYLTFFIREFQRGNERGSNDPAVYAEQRASEPPHSLIDLD